MTRAQLLRLGFTRHAIYHRVQRGRLHCIHSGVFVVGSPELTRLGHWMAAVLACGPGALLSHSSAATLWEIRPQRSGPIHVSIPDGSGRKAGGLRLHRRSCLGPSDCRRRLGIPVTSPVRTLVDISRDVTLAQLEAAVNEADMLGLVDPEALRVELEAIRGQPGVATLRQLLDKRTFRLTRSELERTFIPLAQAAGLPTPETRQIVNGFEVDFFWRELGLVVETDGLRYHRTPAQQARDRVRDQTHTAAGLTSLRFTHAQVRFEAPHVRRVLRRVAQRLREGGRADRRRSA